MRKIKEDTWQVRRYGYVEEEIEADDSLRYHVVVADVGRAPFIKRVFSRRESAENFYDRVMTETAVGVER